MTSPEVAQRPVVAYADGAGGREYRYPGSPPFADTDVSRLVFHGRSREIDEVLHSILSFDLLVVYAISGLGKTSLLSAGVFEHLRERGLFPVIVRLNDPATSPVELIDAQIREAGSGAPDVTVMRNPGARPLGAGRTDSPPATTLWDLLGTLEIWRGNTLLRPVLVFDQFEELFTLGWDDEQRTRFIAELGEVIRRHRSTDGHAGDGRRNDEPTAVPAPNVKVVLVMREDFLGELEALAADVPQIMAHRFRLEALQRNQAKAAICTLAAIDDARLASEPFRYTDAAADAIVDFLGGREAGVRPTRSDAIDPCQLQLICQHVERSIVPAKPASADPDDVVEITEHDLGGRNGLERILSDFYQRELLAFPPRQRALVRDLCETGLINQNRRRLSLEEGEIAARFHVTKPMLDELVARRLLRAEPRVGSVYYELAHDSLTTPILAYRDARRSARRRRVRRRALTIGAVAVAVVAAVVFLSTRSDDEGGPEVVVRPVDVDAGEVLAGSVTANAFEVHVDDRRALDIVVEPTGGGDLTLEVTYPSGATEEATADDDSTIRHTVLASALGTYRLDVVGPSDATFELTVAPAVGLDPLAIDEPLDDRFTAASDRLVFEFAPDDDTPVEITVTPRGTLDAALEVTGPDGVSSRVDADGKGATETLAMSGVVDGPFRITVEAIDTTGSFELSATALELVTIEPGKSHAGRIDEPGDITVLDVDQPEGSFTVVDVRPSTALDAVIQVENATTLEPDTVDRGGEGGREMTIAPNIASLPVRLVVKGYDVSTGPFDVVTTPVPVNPLAVGPSVEGSLTDTMPVAVYVAEIDAPAEYEVELVADDELEAVAFVVSEDAELTFATFTDGSTTNALEAGRYWVVVYSDAVQPGPFSLRVTRET
jgi:Novel STAND NTPase 1